MKYLIWSLVALFVLVIVLIITGWGDKGYDALKKSLAEREIAENQQMKVKLESLAGREQALLDRIRQKDAEINNVNKRLEITTKRLKDAQLKLAQVTVPTDPDLIVNEYRALGYKSFTRIKSR
jgi:uncharacterized protein HemX